MPEGQVGFQWIDWAVVGFYFVGITTFGLWIARKIRTSGAYFLGDRNLPWWVMVGQSFGTGTNAENPVAQAGATYANGFATIWYQWKNMLITPFYWLLAPWYRRSARTTIAEIIEDRYGRKLGLVYTVMAIAFFVCVQGSMLKGGGKVVSAAIGGNVVTPNQVVLAISAAFMLYSFVGGLVASAYTDMIQGVMIIVLSFLLIPSGLAAVGGFSGMRASLPADFFQLFNDKSGIDAFAIAMLALNGVVGITTQPHILSMFATGRSERGGRVGMTYGSMVKRFCTIGWALTGLIVAALVIKHGTTLQDAESAFGYACLHCLGPGLVGLMVACVMAANMSTCSNFMVNTGALFTKSVYVDVIRPGAGDREILLVGRVSGLLLTLLGVGFALKVGSILNAFMFTETIPALLGVMFMGGFLWRRANRQGAAASIVVGFAVYYAANYLMTCSAPGGKFTELWPAVQYMADCWKNGGLGGFLASGQLLLFDKWYGGAFGSAMLAGFVAFVVVSLFTKPESPELLDHFFGRMRRSSDDMPLEETPPSQTAATHEAEPSDTDPRVSAADEEVDLLLLDLPGWLRAARWRGFFLRYREDVLGFILAWGSVALLILVAWGLMQIGR